MELYSDKLPKIKILLRLYSFRKRTEKQPPLLSIFPGLKGIFEEKALRSKKKVTASKRNDLKNKRLKKKILLEKYPGSSAN